MENKASFDVSIAFIYGHFLVQMCLSMWLLNIKVYRASHKVAVVLSGDIYYF